MATGEIIKKFGLSPNHLHTILLIFRHVESLLIDIERLMEPALDQVLFPEYVADLSQEKQPEFKARIQCFRDEMVRIMAELDISPDPPSVSARRFADVTLAFAAMSIEKIESRHMVAYGKLTPGAEEKLSEISRSLQEEIREIRKVV